MRACHVYTLIKAHERKKLSLTPGFEEEEEEKAKPKAREAEIYGFRRYYKDSCQGGLIIFILARLKYIGTNKMHNIPRILFQTRME